MLFLIPILLAQKNIPYKNQIILISIFLGLLTDMLILLLQHNYLTKYETITTVIFSVSFVIFVLLTIALIGYKAFNALKNKLA